MQLSTVMKTFRIFVTAVLLAIAGNSSGQFTLNERYLAVHSVRAAGESTPQSTEKSQVEPWMFDLRTWENAMTAPDDPQSHARSQSGRAEESEVVHETEPMVETWMTAPFSLPMQEKEISLESWMTVPFESGNEIELESWMTTAWI